MEATQKATPPSLPIKDGQRTVINHQRSCIQRRCRKGVLPAQERMLCVILVANAVVFVGEQRRDTYYRNDPSEYDLARYTAKHLPLKQIHYTGCRLEHMLPQQRVLISKRNMVHSNQQCQNNGTIIIITQKSHVQSVCRYLVAMVT